MIASLEGRVAEKAAGRVLVSVHGVGYDVMVSALTLGRVPPVGGAVRLYTRLQVKDEAMLLYGFSSLEEREAFDLLVTVSGVGPKVALAVLSVLAPGALRRAVVGGDVEAITVAPGVGRKVAARVILELKDRLGLPGDGQASGALAEVRDALLALGLSPQEARDVLASLGPDGDRPVEELLREALRSVGR